MNGTAARLLRTNPRLFYVILVFCILIPLLKPMGLPLNITKPVRDAWNFMESLPKGSIVVYSIDVSPSNEAENWPETVAFLHHSVLKGHRIVLATFIPEGVMYSERAVKEITDPAGYVYGKDVVVLPYRAGLETAVAAFSEDFRGTYRADYYGKSAESLPLMQDIKSMKDVALVNIFTAGDNGLYFLRQVEAKYKTPTIVGIVAVGITLYGPYQASGQLKGLLLGQAGAAEYELLCNRPGKGVAAMDAQSIGHVYLILLIVISNILYFSAKRQSKARSASEGGQ